MSSTTAPAVSQLLGNAANEDTIGAASLALLTGATDLGTQINNAMGVPALSFQQSEVVLVSCLLDDSSSIQFGGNTQAIRDGANHIIESLEKSKQQDNILWHSTKLNAGMVSAYVSLANAPKLDAKNYIPSGGTPLYDRTVALLGTVIAKAQEFSDQGVPCRTISLILTDGADTGGRYRAADVKKLVQDMLRQEQHIIAFMGVDDGGTDFKKVADEMGILPEWVLTPAATESEIRKACQVFSQSAVRASQSAKSFSQQALGGFAGP